MLNRFFKNPNYLLHSFIGNLILFCLGDILLYFSYNDDIEFNIDLIFLIPIALIVGLVSATAFHNASHNNIKPRFLNTVIGELTANFSLEDLRCFTVGHMLHHKFTDHCEFDPHPPAGQSFLDFILKSRNNTIRVISHFYFEKHGHGKKQELNVKAQVIIFHFLALSKVLFWYLLFGKTLFFLFFIPCYLSYFFGFAHLNYASHQPDQNGELAIHNRDYNYFYKIMNIITSGGYYHKNHHLSPSLYNPSKLKMRTKG